MESESRGIKVWLPNSGQHHSYNEAEAYGTLCPITEGRVNIFRISEVAAIFNERLKDAGPEDWVLTSGYAVLNALAIHFFLRRYGRCNILQWGAIKREYEKLQLFEPFDA